MGGFPGGSAVENPPAYAGDTGLIPSSGRSPGGGNAHPLQYSCLENPMDRGAWRATAMGSQRVRHDWTCTYRFVWPDYTRYFKRVFSFDLQDWFGSWLFYSCGGLNILRNVAEITKQWIGAVRTENRLVNAKRMLWALLLKVWPLHQQPRCYLPTCAKSLSHVWLFGTLWTVARQAPLSMGFPRQEYWSGLPCPSPGDLPDPGIKPTSLMSPALADGFFTTGTTW